MVKHSKQNWTVGQNVKVGFLTLAVKAAIATPGDGLPDVYFLANQAGDKLYEFTPHHGLQRISLEDAEDKVSRLHAQLASIAAAEADKAAKRAQAMRAMQALFGDAVPA